MRKRVVTENRPDDSSRRPLLNLAVSTRRTGLIRPETSIRRQSLGYVGLARAVPPGTETASAFGSTDSLSLRLFAWRVVSRLGGIGGRRIGRIVASTPTGRGSSFPLDCGFKCWSRADVTLPSLCCTRILVCGQLSDLDAIPNFELLPAPYPTAQQACTFTILQDCARLRAIRRNGNHCAVRRIAR